MKILQLTLLSTILFFGNAQVFAKNKDSIQPGGMKRNPASTIQLPDISEAVTCESSETKSSTYYVVNIWPEIVEFRYINAQDENESYSYTAVKNRPQNGQRIIDSKSGDLVKHPFYLQFGGHKEAVQILAHLGTLGGSVEEAGTFKVNGRIAHITVSGVREDEKIHRENLICYDRN